MAKAKYYPPVNFYFKVVFDDDKFENNADVSFQSVSGLDVQYDTETIKEGGVNAYEHVIPTRTKYSDLILKRGVIKPKAEVKGESEITKWCVDAFEKYIIVPKNFHVWLLNQSGKALFSWYIIHAWPKNWKMTEMNAEKGEIFIETLELNYNRFRFRIPKNGENGTNNQ